MRSVLRLVPPPASLIVPVPNTSVGEDEVARRRARVAYAAATVGMLNIPDTNILSVFDVREESNERSAPLFDGTGTLFATEDVGTSILVHTTGEVHEFYGGYPGWAPTVAILANNRILACIEQCVHGGDWPNGREFILEGHTDLVRGVIGLPDGWHALSGSQDGTVRLWDTDSRSEVARFEAGAPVAGVAAWPDGTLVAADQNKAVYFLRLDAVKA